MVAALYPFIPIRSEADYDQALAKMEMLFDADPDSEQGREAEILALMIEAYEQEHHPIGLPDPIEAIQIRMDDLGLRQVDMVGVIGSQSQVSEVLNRNRPLTLTMIRALIERLNLPAEVLIQAYPLDTANAQDHLAQ